MSNNAVVLRYAIARSILMETPINDDPEATVANTSGFEIARKTLFGDNEIVYKLLMSADSMPDEEFFPKLVNKHIERGLKQMERDYRLAGNKEKFIKNYLQRLH